VIRSPSAAPVSPWPTLHKLSQTSVACYQ